MFWWIKWLQLCECVAPDAKAGNARLIRPHGEADGLERVDDAPKAFAGDEGRCGLDDDGGVRPQLAFEHRVEARCVELAEGEVIRIWKVDDRDIKRLRLRRVQPNERIGI